jgi:Xaa-Pro dipeptidase
MMRDDERVERNTQALIDEGLDALACALPLNVLLLSGYWPVVGASLAISTRDKHVLLIVPEDELELAGDGWADEVISYKGGSLDDLQDTGSLVADELRNIAGRIRIKKLGFESGPLSLPVPYAAVTLFGWLIGDLLRDAFASADLVPAREILSRLRSTLTSEEIRRLRIACDFAESAYAIGRDTIKEGRIELEIAAAFRQPLSVNDEQNVSRADGFMYCMSGENAYNASAAYQISSSRRVRRGDLVLVHCNSYADGLWTDITRTYCLGEPAEWQQQMYQAVFAAFDAALAAARPGVRASQVDAAAREVMEQRGFGKEFKHGLGHSVGFAAIDHNAPPRLHPASPDVLETGMVFNIEPAIYIQDVGGMRHCEMVALTANGSERLTPFQQSELSLVISE